MKKIVFAALAISVIFSLVASACTSSWSPSDEVRGKTPLARMKSIVDLLNSNRDYQKLGRVALIGYDTDNQAWNFSLMIFKSAKELQEADQQIIFSFVKEIFLKAASQVSSNTRINILMVYSNGTVSFISMPPEGVQEMKRYKEAGHDPADWYRYIIEIRAAIQLQQPTQQDKQTDPQQGENKK